MKITKFSKNQIVTETESEINFISYTTLVCQIKDGKIAITKGQPQSKTTAKYLNKFLEMFTTENNYKNLI